MLTKSEARQILGSSIYDQVESIATRLGIKHSRAARLSQLWQCWADRVLEADMHNRRLGEPGTNGNRLVKQRDAMIEAANAYAG